MTEPDEALQYISSQFLKQGVIVEVPGLELVFKYLDEWYVNEYQPDNDIECFLYNEEDKLNYIIESNPDIPITVIKGILEAQDQFFAEGMRNG